MLLHNYVQDICNYLGHINKWQNICTTCMRPIFGSVGVVIEISLNNNGIYPKHSLSPLNHSFTESLMYWITYFMTAPWLTYWLIRSWLTHQLNFSFTYSLTFWLTHYWIIHWITYWITYWSWLFQSHTSMITNLPTYSRHLTFCFFVHLF